MTGPTDPAFWDARYQADGYLYGTRPNAFLVEHAYLLNPDMRVLMAGDGEGRNGVWLAEQGMKVVSVDFSPVALQKATKLALDRGVRLMAVCADLTDWDWPVAEYDAAVAVFLHLPSDRRRAVHRALQAAVKPNGPILIEAFAPDQLSYDTGGPKSAEMLYSAEDLRKDFAEAAIVDLEETVVRLNEGDGHAGNAAVVRLVARAP
jgi:SAM-dependent methyltransferase